MKQITRKPLPEKSLPEKSLTENFKKDTEDIQRVSTAVQEPPPVHPKRFKIFGWESAAHRPIPPPYSETTVYAGAKPTIAQRLDRVLPPHKQYLGIRRKLCLIVLAVLLVLLLALTVGLAVGLSSSSSK